MRMKLRLIRESDIKDVLTIYKPFIKNTAITFEYTIPSLKKFRKRVEHVTAKHPWIVAEANGQIVGYAYAAVFKERMAFSWDVETSIYVPESAQMQGIGTALYGAMEEILKLQGFYNIYAIITSSAKRSLYFHEKMGYQPMYTLEHCGWKFDQWYGITCMCKTIADFNETPREIIPVKDLDKKDIEKILKKYSYADE